MENLLNPVPQISSPHKPVGYIHKNKKNARNSILPSPVPFRMKPKKKSWLSMRGRRALFYCLALMALAYIVISSMGSGGKSEGEAYELAAPNEFVGVESQREEKQADAKIATGETESKKKESSGTKKGVKVELDDELVRNGKKIDTAGTQRSKDDKKDKKVVVIEKGRTNKEYNDEDYDNEYEDAEYMDKMDKKKAAVMNKKKTKAGNIAGSE